jgi:hypothetical protein
MSAPGFTGESALYPTVGHYRSAWSTARGEATLTAALSPILSGGRGRGGRRGCIEGCICVTPEGCPCCDVLPPEQRILQREPSMQTTCEPGTESMCQDWCDHAGGGMSSNPDGSTTCTVYL